MPSHSGMADLTHIPDDPIALRSPRMCRFFRMVMHRQMARSFRAVRLRRPGVPDLPDGAPVVVYSNHPSWWDPAFFMVLTTTLFPDRQGFGPMEADALERYGFMKRIGIFGVESGTRAGAVRFLRVGERILSDPNRMIWMTAQGRFADPRERPVILQRGLAALMARVPGAVAVPLAMEYPFWTEKTPEALAAFGTPLREVGGAEAWQSALADGLAETMDDLARDASARDPGRFLRVQAGRAGVGGVYGAWSRARAALTGARYSPDHEADPFETSHTTGR